MIARLVLLALVLVPGTSWACASCVASAYGDRTFNWAFIGLILMPFAVGSCIAGVFVARYYAPSGRLPGLGRFLRSSGGASAGASQLAPHEES